MRTFITTRTIVGILAISMPFLMLLGSLVMGFPVMPSISHYYYTPMGTVFTGILFAVGLFLVTYKGYGRLDDLSTNLAGVCCFGVALFPTRKPTYSIYNITFPALTPYLHYAFAALLFTALAFISIFIFANDGDKNNWIHLICGILIIICIALVPFAGATLYLETIALCSFGASWLIEYKKSNINTVNSL